MWKLIVAAILCLSLFGCFERVVEPEDVFGAIRRGETYSPASKMIDSWYAVEAIDAQTFAINEPKSSQYNTSYLIVGNERAVMFDAGSSERPAGSKSMRQVAALYTDKPITLILSHFHYDHIYDASGFEGGVTLIDRPEIRAGVKNGLYTISALESVDAEAPPLKVTGFIADGDVIVLGNRTLDVLNLPGHTGIDCSDRQGTQPDLHWRFCLQVSRRYHRLCPGIGFSAVQGEQRPAATFDQCRHTVFRGARHSSLRT